MQGEGGEGKTKAEPIKRDWIFVMGKNDSPKNLYLLGVSILILVLDQLSKTLVTRNLNLGDSVSVLGNFFKITYILNPGGVFGTRLFSGTWYTVIAIFAIFLASYFFFYARFETGLFRLGWALILGGALGNIFDRLRFGQVLDFLDFDFFNLNIPGIINLDRWPVFNLADASVTCGMALIIILVILPFKR